MHIIGRSTAIVQPPTPAMKSSQRILTQHVRTFATQSKALPLNYWHIPARSPPVKSTIVSTHGLLGSGNNWRSILNTPKINQHRDVILADLRNHGQSPHSDDCSLTSMGQDLVQLAESRGVNSFVGLGHSLGGKSLMAAAINQPERFRALIVADIAPVDYSKQSAHAEWSGVSQIVNSLNELDLSQIKSREEADAALKSSIPNTSTRSFALANLVRNSSTDNDAPMFAWRLNISVLANSLPTFARFDVGENAKPVTTVPVLFLAGAQSRFIGESEREAIEYWFPHAEIVTIENARHWIHADQPVATANAINEFLTRHEL